MEIHGVLPNQMYQKSGWIHAESISDCLAHYEITHNKRFGGIKKSGIVFAMRSSGPLPAILDGPAPSARVSTLTEHDAVRLRSSREEVDML